MASQPSAMPAFRWRPNRFLLQRSRPWIWFFIVGAVLVGSVTSAPAGQAYTRCSPIPPNNSAREEKLIERVIGNSTPEEFLTYFIDGDIPSPWYGRALRPVEAKHKDACEFVMLLRSGKISPEQVAKHVTDVRKVLHAFVEMYSKKELKTLECDYANQKLKTLECDDANQKLKSPPKYASKESIGRLLALYERQPVDWMSSGFYDTLREITLGMTKRRENDFDLVFPIIRLYNMLGEIIPDNIDPEKENRFTFQVVVANLPGFGYHPTILPDAFEMLFRWKWWTYSDRFLPTLFHVFSSLYTPGEVDDSLKLRIDIFRRILKTIYKNMFVLPNNVSDDLGEVIRKMFADPYIPEIERKKLLNEFKQLEKVVNPPPDPAEEDFDISGV